MPKSTALRDNRVIGILGVGLAVLGLGGCAATYVAPADPTPVIGVQITGRSGECIDVQGGETTDGSPIVVFQCHGSPNQRWFVKNGVISENYGSCLDVQGGATNDDTPVILVTCSGTFSQQWSITDGRILSLGGKCLSEPADRVADGTPLVLSTCKSTPGQIWTIL